LVSENEMKGWRERSQEMFIFAEERVTQKHVLKKTFKNSTLMFVF
jgi:hypothetical protein